MNDGPPKNPFQRARPSAAERRSHPRYTFTATVEAMDRGTRAKSNGRTSDLSRGGCYVDTISPFPVGTIVKLRLARNKRTIELEARVVYSQVGMGMGLAFGTILPNDMSILDNWIGEASGVMPANLGDTNPLSRSGAGASHAKSRDEQQYVLNEIVIILMRKGIVTEAEGKAMLQRLYK
jgi:hypothetical protein